MKKAAQLIHNKTTNLCENFMSICCKMDGGKFYNRIQSGSFNHRCMAAALRVQCGPRWMTHVWLPYSFPSLPANNMRCAPDLKFMVGDVHLLCFIVASNKEMLISANL